MCCPCYGCSRYGATSTYDHQLRGSLAEVTEEALDGVTRVALKSTSTVYCRPITAICTRKHSEVPGQYSTERVSVREYSGEGATE